jgi:AraC-like DNA-binding protein
MHRQNRLQRIVLSDPQRTAQWMHALQAEQDLKREGSVETILALGQLILTDLARAAILAAPHAPLVDGTDPAMEIIRRRLDDEFAEEHSIEDYARFAKLSREQFSRRFTRHVGCPPVTYRRQRRLHAAMEALRDNDDSIASIAFGCGFVDLAHFNRSFKALANCTPRAYRERFRD